MKSNSKTKTKTKVSIDRPLKDIYVTITKPTLEYYLEFTVRFPDNYEKDFKVSEYEFRSTRMSVRDYIESRIIEFYELNNEQLPKFHIYFS